MRWKEMQAKNFYTSIDKFSFSLSGFFFSLCNIAAEKTLGHTNEQKRMSHEGGNSRKRDERNGKKKKMKKKRREEDRIDE